MSKIKEVVEEDIVDGNSAFVDYAINHGKDFARLCRTQISVKYRNETYSIFTKNIHKKYFQKMMKENCFDFEYIKDLEVYGQLRHYVCNSIYINEYYIDYQIIKQLVNDVMERPFNHYGLEGRPLEKFITETNVISFLENNTSFSAFYKHMYDVIYDDDDTVIKYIDCSNNIVNCFGRIPGFPEQKFKKILKERLSGEKHKGAILEYIMNSGNQIYA